MSPKEVSLEWITFELNHFQNAPSKVAPKLVRKLGWCENDDVVMMSGARLPKDTDRFCYPVKLFAYDPDSGCPADPLPACDRALAVSCVYDVNTVNSEDVSGGSLF